MDITREQKEELTAILKVKIGKEDYESRVEEVLQDYKKKARMDGFRPGKVPMGLVRKLYGRTVLIEEINKILSESVSGYLRENQLQILGEPLPEEDRDNRIDWENDSEFTFGVELGLAPEVSVSPTKKDKVPYYVIQPDQKLIDDTVSGYTRQFGKLEQVESVSGDEVLRGDFIQTDPEGNPVENGIVANDSSFTMEVIKDESVKNALIGTKTGESKVFDVKKALPNETELASVLKIEASMVREIAPFFRFDIREISRFTEAPVNQELYDRAFGEGEVKSEKEFRDRVAKDVEHRLEHESDHRLETDIREYFLGKLSVGLPSAFLKKWLRAVNKDELTEEGLEKDFPSFEDDLRWQLVRDTVMKNNQLTVSAEEIRNSARYFARMQFMQYGLTDLPDERLEQYVDGMLNNEEEKNRITDRLKEDKVIHTLKEMITLDRRKISLDKFRKLYEKK